MPMDRLVSLLRSGTVNGVGIGSDEAEVRGLLGDPDDVSRTRPLVWKYGPLEFAFEASRVVMVVLTAEGDVNPAWDRDTDRERVEWVLTAMRVEFEPEPELTFGTQTALRAGLSGAVLIFDADRDDRLVKAVVTTSGGL
jgi:hypothetical protein